MPKLVVSAAALVLVLSSCSSSPRIATGTLAQAKAKVLQLVNATGAAAGTSVTYTPPTSADALPCKKKVFGYTVGSDGAQRAEIPVEVPVKGTADGASLLPRIEQYWRSQGYTIDRSGLSDRSFPKVRAHVGTDDLLVATGYVGLPRVNLYAVSACVKP